ncbi:HNH endonuclease [Nocardioides carbamazepini]|uniref:HNH endonuclease n=1 Tax=Nocardioides carbamazepini TaxID=2854259 RepID=UPI002149C89A|nr:HNH endonuclease signature motif containing protein [Nocardioides carbamazepini]MCR1785324.1 HNH endonuclease [Nocardioides carbamazepini]
MSIGPCVGGDRDNAVVGSKAGATATAARRIGVDLAEYVARRQLGQKWCTKCKEWRREAQFTRDRSRSDGLRSTCFRHSARDDGRPGKPERQKAAQRGLAWCRGCTAWLPSDAVQGGLCREHTNAEARERYAATAGRGRRGRSAARRRGVRPVGTETRELLYEATQGLCAYGCGRAATTLDHVIPVASGGQSVPGNVVPACRSCNSSKRDRDPWPWIDRLTPDGLDLVSAVLVHDGAIVDLLGAA